MSTITHDTDDEESTEESIRYPPASANSDANNNETADISPSGQDEDDSTEHNDADVGSIIRTFVAKHKQWRDHVLILEREPESAEGRATFMAAKKAHVQLHSLQKDSMNGTIGTLVDYVSTKDRFTVDLGGKEVAIRACNLRLVENDVEQDVRRVEEDVRMTSHRERLVSAIFRPGTLLLGTIQIPGLSGAPGRKEYTMYIVSDPITDEMGQQTGILARHRAYEDEQFVWIHIDMNETEDTDQILLSIRYADGETQCRGKWNEQKGQFEGTVHQLLPTEDGGTIYHPRDEVTHTFVLSPTTVLHPKGIAMEAEEGSESQSSWEEDLLSAESRAIVEHRSKTEELGAEVVEHFYGLCMNYENWSVCIENSTDPVRRTFSEVAWKDLALAGVLAAERSCATLRRRAELLDSLSFASVEERKNTLIDLKNKGVTRALAHTDSDERKETVQSIVVAWKIIGGTPGSSNGPRTQEITDIMREITVIMRICWRLESNFARFDAALRRAEERLTEAHIRQWVVPLSKNEC